MRRLEIITKIVAVVLALSAFSKMIAVVRGKRDIALLLSLGVTVALFLFSIFWVKAVVARKSETVVITVIFMCLPVVAAVVNIASVWSDNEDLVFKGWVTLCLVAVTGIYVRLATYWCRKLRRELNSGGPPSGQAR